MPPIVIDLHSAEDSRDVVHQVVQSLTEGQLVLFPTETVYGIGASACSEEGVQRLIEAKGRSRKKPFALAIKSAEEALDYVPRLGAMGERLARRCWPGPITLVVDYTPGEGLVDQLPPSVQKAILASDSSARDEPSADSLAVSDHPQICWPGQNPNEALQTLGLRVPAHEIVLEVLKLLAGPIVLSSANRSGEPAAVTTTAALPNLETEVALALDDGRCHYGQPSTVVRVTQNTCTCLRAGVVGSSALDRLSSMIILFVCTGNTCRSPMAEAIMRRQIARRLGIDDDRLERPDCETGRCGVIVTSAGIAALPGCGPSCEAVEVMRDLGMDLRNHQSQPLTDKLVRHADFIYTMTAAHRQALLRRWPDIALRTHLVRTDARDIADPIGGTEEVYRQCRAEIDHAVQHRVHAAPTGTFAELYKLMPQAKKLLEFLRGDGWTVAQARSYDRPGKRFSRSFQLSNRRYPELRVRIAHLPPNAPAAPYINIIDLSMENLLGPGPDKYRQLRTWNFAKIKANFEDIGDFFDDALKPLRVEIRQKCQGLALRYSHLITNFLRQADPGNPKLGDKAITLIRKKVSPRFEGVQYTLSENPLIILNLVDFLYIRVFYISR